MRRKEFYEYPKRTCYSMHECAVCERPIKLGETYFDGGLNRRCHTLCAPPKRLEHCCQCQQPEYIHGGTHCGKCFKEIIR
jgi:hypothetical protein